MARSMLPAQIAGGPTSRRNRLVAAPSLSIPLTRAASFFRNESPLQGSRSLGRRADRVSLSRRARNRPQGPKPSRGRLGVSTKVVRGAGLRRRLAASLLDQLGKGKRRQSHRVKERVHGHGNENRTAPFVGDRETRSENKERRERRQVPMDSCEEERTQNYAGHPADITFGDAIEEESKDEFLGQRRQ